MLSSPILSWPVLFFWPMLDLRPILSGMRAASPRYRSLALVCALLACVFITACGAPAAPTPPRPVLPKPVADLAARQQGSSVILTFTLPKKSDENETLAEPPAIE